MKLHLFENESSGAGWKRAAHAAAANGHSNLEFAVYSVEMRRVVIAIEDCDCDSEKAGNDGHVAIVQLLWVDAVRNRQSWNRNRTREWEAMVRPNGCTSQDTIDQTR